jgi:hypothetical protein
VAAGAGFGIAIQADEIAGDLVGGCCAAELAGAADLEHLLDGPNHSLQQKVDFRVADDEWWHHQQAVAQRTQHQFMLPSGEGDVPADPVVGAPGGLTGMGLKFHAGSQSVRADEGSQHLDAL